tara:strand:+ start:1012325 stop:1012750 length:426 start_codon:yes stop_codon:yes gene_type:complete
MRKSNARVLCSSATRGGFTLLEVVVGLILMATVLIGSMLSYSAHQRQLVASDKRIAAVSFADDLLSQLTAGQRRMPTSIRGVVAAQPNWYWQTAIIGRTAPMNVPMDVVRLSVFEVRPDGTVQVLTSVDVVEPIDLLEPVQ